MSLSELKLGRHAAKSRGAQWVRWWLALSIYYLLLLSLYGGVIADLWGYSGFIENLNRMSVVLSLVLLGLGAMVFAHDNIPSYFYLKLIVLIVAIPFLVVFSGSGSVQSPLVVLGVGLSVLMATVKILPPISIRIWNGSEQILRLVLYWLSIGTLLGVIAINGTRYFNLDIFSVYEYRSEISSQLPGVFYYLNSIVTKVAIPFLLASAVIKKKKLAAMGLAVLSVGFFAFTAHKAPLFYPFAVIAMVYMARSDQPIRWLLFALLGVVIYSFLEIYFTESLTITSLFARRALLLPALLNLSYIEFFSTHAFNFWSDSRVTLGVFDVVYPDGISHTIGSEQFGKPGMGANVGWIGSGYAQAGYVGVILYSAMLGLSLRMMDGVQRRFGREMVLAMYVVPISTVILSSDFMTGLLNHGLLLALLLPGLVGEKRSKYKTTDVEAGLQSQGAD